ncbi:MAG: hypothetical protein FWH19_05285 [Treponema sp.]|nr:hypothetical protein [Treponema sp.]
MSAGHEKLKEQLHKKSLMEIEAIVSEQKRKMASEKDFNVLSHLSADLSVMQEIRDQKQVESGRKMHKTAQSTAKPELKSYEDYVKSKK